LAKCLTWRSLPNIEATTPTKQCGDIRNEGTEERWWAVGQFSKSSPSSASIYRSNRLSWKRRISIVENSALRW
jgi:hypothetical protein